MTARIWAVLMLLGALLIPSLPSSPALACCPAGPYAPGDKGVMPVVNADQSVIIIWDAVTKTQHFIRKASFKSEADDFGFLVPTPSEPEVEESGNEAFPHLYDLTKPEIKIVKVPSGEGGGMGCGCAKSGKASRGGAKGTTTAAGREPEVTVRLEKEVAGFHAAVLQTKSAAALVKWLEKNGYAFSPEVAAWAKPYVESGAGWMITALKVAKDKEGKAKKSVSAAALRLSFKTDRPLFPYREPDSRSAVAALLAKERLLRIYFLADARYQGELTKEVPWTGKVVWANPLSAEQRKETLELLKLPENTGPAERWLTEFEDPWPYRLAPADVYFSPDANQNSVKRPPIIRHVAALWPTDVTVYAIGAALILLPFLTRVRRRKEVTGGHRGA